MIIMNRRFNGLFEFYFGGGGPGAPPPPPKPPAQGDATAAANRNLYRMQNRQGFSSTILTGGMGVGNQTSNKKTLLGD